MEHTGHIRSDCCFCAYLNNKYPNVSCPAFPKGIPREIFYNIEKHRVLRDDQIGDYTFKPSQWAIDNDFPLDLPTEKELKLKWKKDRQNKKKPPLARACS